MKRNLVGLIMILVLLSLLFTGCNNVTNTNKTTINLKSNQKEELNTEQEVVEPDYMALFVNYVVVIN